MQYSPDASPTPAHSFADCVTMGVLEPLSTLMDEQGARGALIEAVLSVLPVSVAVLDRDGIIVAVNTSWRRFAREHGAPSLADDSVGLSYLAACHTCPEIEAGLRAVLEGTQPSFATEYPCDSPTQRGWFVVRVTPLPGRVGGALVAHVDITERKLAEEERARLLAFEYQLRAEQEIGWAEAETRRATAVERATKARLRALQALTDTRFSHLALDDLLRELLDRELLLMGVDSAGILLLDEDGRTLTARAARGIAAATVGRVQVPMGRGFAGRIAASREPLIVDDLSTCEFVDPLLPHQACSAAGVPLLVEDQLVGVLYVGSATARCFTGQDMQLLQLAADRLAPAVDRARMYAAEQEARARAEEALARATVSEARATERAEQLHTILETMADGIAVAAQDGRILQTNRAFRDLLALDRAPGFESMPSSERGLLIDLRDARGQLLPPDQLPIPRALRGEVVAGPSAEFRLRALDGREMAVNISAAPLRDSAGRITGAVLVMRDVSWRRHLEREREDARAGELALQEMTQRMDEFLATASHDLRSPLAVAVAAIDLAALHAERLESTVASQPPVAGKLGRIRECLDEARRGVDRLTRLVAVLFDTSLAHAGRLELRPKPFDLVAVVREQVAALRLAHPQRTLQLEVKSEQPLRVVADADRIGQVVMNYLTNALKYSVKDQPVEVLVEANSLRARVAVRDFGPGLPSDEQQQVWQRFYRVPGIRVRSGTSSGLGLGLHISKTIIEEHGGAVGVESAVGAGSTFWFTLPLRQHRAAPGRLVARGIV